MTKYNNIKLESHEEKKNLLRGNTAKCMTTERRLQVSTSSSLKSVLRQNTVATCLSLFKSMKTDQKTRKHEMKPRQVTKKGLKTVPGYDYVKQREKKKKQGEEKNRYQIFFLTMFYT